MPPTFSLDMLIKLAGQLGVVGVIVWIGWCVFSFVARVFEKQQENQAQMLDQQWKNYERQMEALRDDYNRVRKESEERNKELHEKFERIVGDLKSIITTNTGAMVELKGMINNLADTIRERRV